jgi:hypothetical protein
MIARKRSGGGRSRELQRLAMDEPPPTWSFSMPDEGTAFPEHLVEAVWS